MKNIGPENWYRNTQFLFWVFIAIAAGGSYGATQFFASSWTVGERQFHWSLVKARGWSLVPIIGEREKIRVGTQRVTAGELVTFARARPDVWRSSNQIVFRALGAGVGGGFAAVLVVVLLSATGGGSARGDKHLRGARIVPSWRLRAKLEFERARDRVRGRAPDKKPIRIDGLPVPHSLEPLHFLFAGSTGVGKSQLIHSFLDVVRRRGDRAIVADIGADLLSASAANGDSLLNPLDARSRAWSPFAEMRTPSDAERIAQTMIPTGEGEHAEWHRYSQSLIAAVLLCLFERGEAMNERLLYYLTIAKSEEIEALITGLPAQTLFDTGAAKMLSSVRGIIGSYLPSYRYLDRRAGVDAFSISRWVEQEGSSWLWLPYRDKDSTTLRPLLSAWIGEAVSAVLSLRPDPGRRIWLVLDELASLGRVSGLGDALTKGRRFGLCSVLGIQSISQLREIYGREGATTLLSCARSAVTFATDDPDTADYMSRRMGEQEVQREDQSRGDHGSTVSTRRDRSRIVLPSEIENLPNLTAFLNLAGDYPATKIHIPFRKRDERIKPFEPRKNDTQVSKTKPVIVDSLGDPLGHINTKPEVVHGTIKT